MRNSPSIFNNIDWFSILLYLILVFAGWLNIYAAVYNEEFKSIFDASQQYGKQLIWIGTSVGLVIILLFIDERFFNTFAYVIYGIIISLLVLVIVIGAETKGATSWFEVGGFKIQPSEFAKFATSLAVAKYLSTMNVKMSDLKTKAIALTIIFLPSLLILAQNDTGSALVYGAFILVLYREGLSGNILLIGVSAAFLFVMALIMRNEIFHFPFKIEIDGTLLLIISLGLFSTALWYFNRKSKQIIYISIAILVGGAGLIKSVDYIFNNVLEPHQSKRINVMLGLESDPKGAGYNVNQSLIAIGSGGIAGKGFLEGTQTKYNFVPEQSTDFIFCTIGEEWGFLGALVIIILFVTLLLRIMYLTTRQRSDFARIYGYGVACILFFHFAINIGMTIGLAPVIGIPLPFFSYGGSSLWGFTILLFIFLKLDSDRMKVL
ncbi:rod shape-determining protein RodA [Acidiluteibacter ferrifornacis]|uniref:Cell wall polymerase n=1 Tax=Acidiluteibacter ferrifornacis TaxID=2692424 RepID=A0A6N9NG17_9FLAO|nr:rod shape-determining protein RodA [Acidiluteibacter ferrifornacis]NBG64734.1 rod shape-determining protein RodA [Acidiluteibacter ferrifornacis]